MNIVTVMNYDWTVPQHVSLCDTWIYYADKFLTELDTVYIYSAKTLPKKLYLRFLDCRCVFKSIICPGYESNIRPHFSPQHIAPISNHNFWYKLYVACHTDFPFLFIDCDALIVDKINELEQVFTDTTNSIFFIDHETNIPKQTDMCPPFINSGVYIMNDPTHKIYNFRHILNHAKSIGFFPTFKNGNNIPGTDQAIIKSYLDHLKYDYHHPILDNRYNASANMVDISRKNYYKIIHYWGSQKEGFPYL